MYIIRGGILDGRAGWYLSWSISGYEMQVQLKYRELCRLKGKVPEARESLAESEGQLATIHARELDQVETVDTGAAIANRLRKPRLLAPMHAPTRATLDEAMASSAAAGGEERPRIDPSADPLKPVPTVIFTRRPQPGGTDHRSGAIVPEFTSPWTFRQNVKRALWMITTRLLFKPSFHNWYGWRRFLLRAFGARIGQGVRVRPSAMVEIPWNVEIDDGAVVGDFAILYSLGKITIGKRTVVSQYAHLCAGTHDHRYSDFPLVRPPITIGDDAWIAADSFVGPGVTVGARTVVGARSNVFVDLPDDVVAVGSPAKPIRERIVLGAAADREHLDEM